MLDIDKKSPRPCVGVFSYQLSGFVCFKILQPWQNTANGQARLGRQLMNDYIGGADHQVRRAGGSDVKAEMEHIAINNFIVASFDA